MKIISIDTEFTSSDITYARLMSIGAYEPESKKEFYQAIQLTDGVLEGLSDWHRENLKGLIRECKYSACILEQTIEDLTEWIRQFGNDVIPLGWCLGSDMVLIFDILLGQLFYHSKSNPFHYRWIDIEPLVQIVSGYKHISEERIVEHSIGEKNLKHNALQDAKDQWMIYENMKKMMPVWYLKACRCLEGVNAWPSPSA